MDDARKHEDERLLLQYLERNQEPKAADQGDNAGPGIWQRVECCRSSRSLYCPECCTVLIPRDHWPTSIRNGSLSLPFTFDIVLDVKERRSSSTGIQVMAICDMMARCSSNHNGTERPNKEDLKTVSTFNDFSCDSFWWRNANLYDLSRVPVPQYTDLGLERENRTTHGGCSKSSAVGTYVLFPQKGKSVPLSSVAHKLRRLVVLDIKWSRLGLITTNNPNLAGLPFVHLEFPPKESHFWRWHSAGDGMLSTAEAIYCAALEVRAARGCPEDGRGETMLDVLWLFALQRSIIGRRNVGDGVPVAYSKEGKARHRAARVRKDGMDRSARERRAQKGSFYDEISQRGETTPESHRASSNT
jgi:DTW domain